MTVFLPKNPRHRLPELAVGRASSLELSLAGVPDGLENVEVHVRKIGTESYGVAVARRTPGGEWQAYMNGAYFPDAGRSGYYVTARTERGDSRLLGSGTVEILPSVLNIDAAEVPIIPVDTYVRDPNTGLYHLLTVTVDEDGSLVPEIAREGIVR